MFSRKHLLAWAFQVWCGVVTKHQACAQKDHPETMIKLPSNSKLGTEVASFSLPAKTTCPGRSSVCEKYCYAGKGNFTFTAVQKSYNKNLEMSQSATFVADMVEAITVSKQKTVRLHPSGDFYSVEYIGKWMDIARQMLGVTFYAYTRSWRVEALTESLLELSRLPNVRLWLSTDDETGEPPAQWGLPTAHMQVNDEDSLVGSPGIVFRVRRKTKLPKVGGCIVCPAENGVEYAVKPTCSKCKLCFKRRKSSNG